MGKTKPKQVHPYVPRPASQNNSSCAICERADSDHSMVIGAPVPRGEQESPEGPATGASAARTEQAPSM
jgi:hypothetical protein